MPFLETPVTLLLLVITGLVSGYALYADRSLVGRLGFRPRLIRESGQWYRYVTAAFVHVALWHLAFNLITLFFFGPPLERLLGSVPFALVYFGSVLSAHGLTYAVRAGEASYSAVGASGGISGVLVGFCLFQPFSLIYFFGLVPIPAILFAVGFVVFSFMALGREGRIAHEAHLGGALGGGLLTVVLEPGVIAVFLGHFGL